MEEDTLQQALTDLAWMNYSDYLSLCKSFEIKPLFWSEDWRGHRQQIVMDMERTDGEEKAAGL